jgi:hypothetical protein
MSQFGRPASDITVGAWNSASGTLYPNVNEVSPDDATLIRSGAMPSNDTCELGLDPLGEPEVDTGHIVRYRHKESGAATTLDLTVSLYQEATLIASWTTAKVGTSYVTTTQNLSEAEAGAITDYADLRLRLMANQVGGSAMRKQVSWLELEIPDGIPPPPPVGFVGWGVPL